LSTYFSQYIFISQIVVESNKTYFSPYHLSKTNLTFILLLRILVKKNWRNYYF